VFEHRYNVGEGLCNEIFLVVMKPLLVNGEEPPIGIAKLMKEVDVVIMPLSKSLSHTKARKDATKVGVRVYLDYSATTPVDDEVLKVMQPYFTENFGNPNSLHAMGQDARRAIDDAREQIKIFLGADVLREIIFTGSATEASNLAIYGAVKQVAGAFGDSRPRHPRKIISASIQSSLSSISTALYLGSLYPTKLISSPVLSNPEI